MVKTVYGLGFKIYAMENNQFYKLLIHDPNVIRIILYYDFVMKIESQFLLTA